MEFFAKIVNDLCWSLFLNKVADQKETPTQAAHYFLKKFYHRRLPVSNKSLYVMLYFFRWEKNWNEMVW